jgi:hypothetical protein
MPPLLLLNNSTSGTEPKSCRKGRPFDESPVSVCVGTPKDTPPLKPSVRLGALEKSTIKLIP